MMKRIVLCIVLIGAPYFVAAQTVHESIVSQLQDQGFSQIQTTRTWLRRTRVTARRDDMTRELVFNPQTGEILRDYWRSDGPRESGSSPVLLNPVPGTNSSDVSGNRRSGSGRDGDRRGRGDDD